MKFPFSIPALLGFAFYVPSAHAFHEITCVSPDTSVHAEVVVDAPGWPYVRAHLQYGEQDLLLTGKVGRIQPPNGVQVIPFESGQSLILLRGNLTALAINEKAEHFATLSCQVGGN